MNSLKTMSIIIFSLVELASSVPLSLDAVAEKYLRQLRSRVEAMGTQLLLPRELVSWLRNRCRTGGGARALRKLIQTEVEGPLAVFLLSCPRSPGKVTGKIEGEKLFFV